MTVQIRNPDGEYDPNDIYIYYYKEPAVQKQSAEFAYINEDKMLIFSVDFAWGERGNHYDFFRDNANLTCRFSAAKNGSLILYADAFMETSPIGLMKTSAHPDQITEKCKELASGDPTPVSLSAAVARQSCKKAANIHICAIFFGSARKKLAPCPALYVQRCSK